MDSPLVVTGIGLTTSLGAGVEECWQSLLAGTCGLRPLGELEIPDASVHEGGIAPLPPGVAAPAAFRDGRARAQASYVQVITEALAAAGAGRNTRSPERTGLFVGSSLAASASSADFWDGYIAAGPEAADYARLWSYDVEPLLAALCERFEVAGPAMMVSNACASGASCLALARDALASGEIDLAIAAGGDTFELHTFAGFHSLGLLSPEPLRPFGAARRGMKLGDGFAAFVIEREDAVRPAGRPVRARLLGCGESADAYSLTQPQPDGSGAALAMRRALRAGGRVPADVDYVNLHATATQANDLSEYRALAEVFGERLGAVLLHALKPSLGHTLGAAGAVEAAVTVKVLEEQHVPPTLGADDPDPELGPLRFGAGPAEIRHAMSNAFGFGGANSSVLFGAP